MNRRCAFTVILLPALWLCGCESYTTPYHSEQGYLNDRWKRGEISQQDVHLKLDFNAGPKCNNDFFLKGTKFDVVPGMKETKDVKEGEWATLEIIVKGDSVEHKINGATVRTSKATAPSSKFMLRAEFGDIQIKNIRVKE